MKEQKKDGGKHHRKRKTEQNCKKFSRRRKTRRDNPKSAIKSAHRAFYNLRSPPGGRRGRQAAAHDERDSPRKNVTRYGACGNAEARGKSKSQSEAAAASFAYTLRVLFFSFLPAFSVSPSLFVPLFFSFPFLSFLCSLSLSLFKSPWVCHGAKDS